MSVPLGVSRRHCHALLSAATSLASCAVHLVLDYGSNVRHVLVLGPTGSGKSSLIRTITGDESIAVSCWAPETKRVRSYDVWASRLVTARLGEPPSLDLGDELCLWRFWDSPQGYHALHVLSEVAPCPSDLVEAVVLHNCRHSKKLGDVEEFSKALAAPGGLHLLFTNRWEHQPRLTRAIDSIDVEFPLLSVDSANATPQLLPAPLPSCPVFGVSSLLGRLQQHSTRRDAFIVQ